MCWCPKITVKWKSKTRVLTGFSTKLPAGAWGAVLQCAKKRGVEGQRCFGIPRQECRPVQKQVPHQQCHEVPRQQCSTVLRQQCQNVSRQQCSAAPAPICRRVLSSKKQQCSSIPRQQYRASNNPQCKTVTNESVSQFVSQCTGVRNAQVLHHLAPYQVVL